VEYVKERDVQRSSYNRANVVQECDMQTKKCISGILVSPFINGALNQAQRYYNASIGVPSIIICINLTPDMRLFASQKGSFNGA
jgi:hypothetical protein